MWFLSFRKLGSFRRRFGRSSMYSDKPIYKDPCQGRPNLPMSVKSDGTVVHDQYLEMKQGGGQKATTPVYADPHAMLEDGQLYENEASISPDLHRCRLLQPHKQIGYSY